MKTTTFYILLAGMASVLIARAQTNPAMPNQTVNPTNAASVGAPAPNIIASVTTSNGETNQVTTAIDTVTSNSTPVMPLSAIPAAIPLVQFSDVALSTAIENLARLAGINYMLDPNLSMPDQTGTSPMDQKLSIRWENITAESALLALLDNYGFQLINDKKTGIGRVTRKDPLAPPQLITRVVQLKYSSTSNMTESVTSVLTDKRSKVIPDRRTSQIIIVATDPEQQAADTLIAQLDKPTKQVLIETKLVEISSNPTTKKGVDWSSTLSSQNVAFGNGSIDPTKSSTTVVTPAPSGSSSGPALGGVSSTPSSVQSTVLNLIQGNGGLTASTASGLIPTTGFLTADGVKATISFLNAAYDAEVVSTPRIVTLDNETATIAVTRTYPILQLASGTQQSSGSSSVTYSNVGTILVVTPRISANDYIWLKVTPTVSSHFGDIIVTVNGGGANGTTTYPVPEFDSRQIESQVLIPNGNTLVMGGLIQDSPNASYTKVPILGDIPGLGWAFRSENKSMSKDNLIIFLTPTIVQTNDFQLTATDFLKSKAKTMKSPMNPHSMWDGAEPRTDWSNPAPLPAEFDKQTVSPGNQNY